MGARIGNYFQTHSDPNPDPADQATAEDLRRFLLAGRKSATTLMNSAPVENPEGEESASSWAPPRQDPTLPPRDERVEELAEEGQQEGPRLERAEVPLQEVQGSERDEGPPREGQEMGRVEEIPMDQPQPGPSEGDEGTPALAAVPEQPSQPPSPATQGQARPCAVDFMQVVETPLMITERGERPGQDRAMAAPGGNQPEVPD